MGQTGRDCVMCEAYKLRFPIDLCGGNYGRVPSATETRILCPETGLLGATFPDCRGWVHDQPVGSLFGSNASIKQITASPGTL